MVKDRVPVYRQIRNKRDARSISRRIVALGKIFYAATLIFLPCSVIVGGLMLWIATSTAGLDFPSNGSISITMMVLSACLGMFAACGCIIVGAPVFLGSYYSPERFMFPLVRKISIISWAEFYAPFIVICIFWIGFFVDEISLYVCLLGITVSSISLFLVVRRVRRSEVPTKVMPVLNAWLIKNVFSIAWGGMVFFLGTSGENLDARAGNVSGLVGLFLTGGVVVIIHAFTCSYRGRQDFKGTFVGIILIFFGFNGAERTSYIALRAAGMGGYTAVALQSVEDFSAGYRNTRRGCLLLRADGLMYWFPTELRENCQLPTASFWGIFAPFGIGSFKSHVDPKNVLILPADKFVLKKW